MSHRWLAIQKSETRAVLFKNCLFMGFGILLVTALQVTLLPHFCVFGAVPDLAICTLLTIAYFWGMHAGAIAGIVMGFFVDATGGTGIMLLPVAYLFFGYLIGHYARVTPRTFGAYACYLLPTLMYRAILTTVYAALNLEYINLWRFLIDILLPEMGATALCGLVIYFPVKGIYSLFWKKRRSY